MEIWKDIQGYEGLYQISNLGNVKSLSKREHSKEKVLKPLNMNKYYYVRLSKNDIATNFSIHRLVAETFIPNLENKSQVNHINGDKHNNNLENLEWITPAENVRHAYKNNLINKKRKNKTVNYSKKIIQKDLDGNILKIWNDYYSLIQSNKSYKIDTISKVCCKRFKSSYGYIWEFYG